MRALIFILILIPSLPAYSLDLGRVLFVANDKTKDVTVIDTIEDRVLFYIPLPWHAWQLAVSDSRNLLIVSELSRGGIMLIDTETQMYLKHIDLDINPEHMQLSPDGSLLAIVDNPGNSVGFVSLDPPYEVIINGKLDAPHNVVFTSDNAGLLIANQDIDAVSVLDTETGDFDVDLWLDDGGSFGGVTDVNLLDGGRKALAVSSDQHEVALIDLDEQKMRTRITTPFLPYKSFPAEDGQSALVTDFDGGINRLTLNGDVEHIHQVDGLPIAVHSMMFGSVAAIVVAGQEQLGLVDLDTGQSLPSIELPAPAERGIVSPDGMKLYLPLPEIDAVVVVSALERKIANTIHDVGGHPWLMTMSGAVNYCY